VIVYLIHLSRPLKHARHYLGTTADLKQRMEDHRAGRGAAMLRACNRKGIAYRVVRTWKRAGFRTEQAIKKLNRRELCPTCSGRAAMRRGK
jgi:predicted GIY-YIG superfamily endonuclease